MLSEITKEIKEVKRVKDTKAVVNFMGGTSYELNPLETLKMVTASSIFGEPQYYRDGQFAEKGIKRDACFGVDQYFAEYSILQLDNFKDESGKSMTTSAVMEKLIDEALDYDFEAVLEWAVTLRKQYKMRLNPQIIMVRAALHPKRQEYTDSNPKAFGEYNQKVMSRADDVIAQITYYIFKTNDKKGIPGILKRSWAKKISSMSAYEMGKYKNKGIGLIDSIRICHAHSALVDELMKTGTVTVEEKDKTWETLRAGGMGWAEILDTIKMNHMALLRNLRGIFNEIEDLAKVETILNDLKEGVPNGKQYPFRYMSALKAVDNGISNEFIIGKTKDALNDCLDIACDNLPKLKGTNAFLSDNSGSAWGAFTSQYGKVTVADIGNISATIGAANSDNGIVVAFGDKMKKYPISKREGILTQAEKISNDSDKLGQLTECGIWLFLDEAIEKRIHYDNIFIYSDMQAGHGILYGTDNEINKYCKKGYGIKDRYIDVAKIISDYRKKVNPKVNVYCIQTAGYSNVLVPEYGYRTNILYGWTGEELVFADIMNKFWDEFDEKENKQTK